LKIFFLILGIVGGEVDPTISLIKIPISTEIKRITCEEDFDKHTTWKIKKHYEVGNNQVWGYHTHKDKPVILHFCKDKKGNWVR